MPDPWQVRGLTHLADQVEDYSLYENIYQDVYREYQSRLAHSDLPREQRRLKRCIELAERDWNTDTLKGWYDSVYGAVSARSAHGTGKALPLSTAVPTPNGERRWGDLAQGDEIIG